MESQGQWLCRHVPYTSFWGFLQTKHALPVSCFQNFLCPGSDDESRSKKGGRWDVSEVYCQEIVESTDVEMRLSIKLKGILRPKSVRKTLVTGQIFVPRANKQFDIAF